MRKKKVLLFNDNSKRDLLGLRLLENALKEQNLKTKICNPENVKVILRQFRPHAFIVARADRPISMEASRICKVFVVPGEGGHQTKETMLSVFMGRGYWKLDSVEWITRCYLWNDNTKKWLKESNLFKDSQLKVIGNTRLDIYQNKQLISNITKKKNQPFRIGVAFSAKSTSTYYGRPRFAKVYHDMNPKMTFPVTQPGKHFEDIVWRDHSILRNIMQIIREYLDQGIGEIWLRPSPFEDPDEYKFLEKAYPGKVKIFSNQTLPEFLGGVDALLTCWSTVGLEALLLNIPVISIAGLLDKEHLFSHISPVASGFETFVKFYNQPKTKQKLIEILNNIKKGKKIVSEKPKNEINNLLKNLYNWKENVSSSALIAMDIAKEVELIEDYSKLKWKKTFPLPFNIPPLIGLFLIKIRIFIKLLKSGSFKVYWDFLKNNDSNVENLLSKIKK